MQAPDLITAVLAEGGFDVTRAQALTWLNERLKQAVAESGWRRAQQQLGPIIAGQQTYAFDNVNVVTVEELEVGSSPYERAGERDLWDLQAGRRWVVGPGGVFVPSQDASGTVSIALWPIPTTQQAGQAITALVTLEPVVLTDDPSVAPTIPLEFHEALISGAIATGLARIDGDLQGAQAWQQQFDDMVQKLIKRGNARIGGSRPVQIKIAGIHW